MLLRTRRGTHWEQVEERVENTLGTPKSNTSSPFPKDPPPKKMGVTIKCMLILHWLRRISIPKLWSSPIWSLWQVARA
jgi:hypothetical protein